MDYFSLYDTYHCVRIKDKRLGFLYWALFVSILLYIVGYVIFYNKGYLEYETPTGVLSVTLKKPRNLTIDASENTHYCVDESSHSDKGVYTSKCKIWHPLDIVYPPSTGDTISITTSITEMNWERVCAENALQCDKIYEETSNDHFFIAGIEQMELTIEHTMQVNKFTAEKLTDRFYHNDDDEETVSSELFTESSRNMEGKLLSSNGTTLLYFSEFRRDRIPIQTLLQAAGTSLDDISDNQVRHGYKPKHPKTLRSRGLVLYISLSYDNTEETWFGVGAPKYSYRVYRLHETSHQLIEPLLEDHESTDPENEKNHLGHKRTFRKRSGIYLKFDITGRIGRPSFMAFLINVASAMSLVTIASLIVDQLALYILPFRNAFETAKYSDQSDTFSQTDKKRKIKEEKKKSKSKKDK
eukprot:TRINITY_DN2882_c0_g1_i5.p1 TRINITY_DN2882_c0_g1~~TRINITY_DN2882_c0_g1_i5.p1  ORF type:complete len:412 (+),score=47.57 TRINITY_DN2882_c0_g1_i5:98-1333(+)